MSPLVWGPLAFLALVTAAFALVLARAAGLKPHLAPDLTPPRADDPDPLHYLPDPTPFPHRPLYAPVHVTKETAMQNEDISARTREMRARSIEPMSGTYDTLHTASGDALVGPWALTGLGATGPAVFVDEAGDVVPLSTVTWARRVDDDEDAPTAMARDAALGAIRDLVDAFDRAPTSPGSTALGTLAKIANVLDSLPAESR